MLPSSTSSSPEEAEGRADWNHGSSLRSRPSLPCRAWLPPQYLLLLHAALPLCHVQGPAQVEAGTDGGFLYSFLVMGQGLIWGGPQASHTRSLTGSQPPAGLSITAHLILRMGAAAGGSYGPIPSSSLV